MGVGVDFSNSFLKQFLRLLFAEAKIDFAQMPAQMRLFFYKENIKPLFEKGRNFHFALGGGFVYAGCADRHSTRMPSPLRPTDRKRSAPQKEGP